MPAHNTYFSKIMMHLFVMYAVSFQKWRNVGIHLSFPYAPLHLLFKTYKYNN